MDQKQIILNFLRRHLLTVIATVTPDNQPEAAVIGFAETDNLELIFETSINYRKYLNLQKNSRAAFVIGWDEEITVQYEGIVSELADQELGSYQAILFAKNPKAAKRRDQPEIRYFKVSPTWIRYSDLSQKPWQIFEINP